MHDEKQLDGLSHDNVHERIEALKRMFPEAVKEGRLDYDTFMALLGDDFDNDREKYDFTWKGKLDSLKLAQRRSSGTLRPDMEQSRDWDTTGNLYLEGDNLEVMKLLQQGYLRKVKMIYIDPPYNTGNDFVYEDDFADPIAKYKEATGQGMRANPETAGRYHSRWLSMMYPRLKIAKTLLRDDGVIFISIDDNEVHNLRKLCDDVFGEENRMASFIWKRRQNVDSRTQNGVSEDHEYLVCYSRSVNGRIRGKPIDKSKYSNPDNDPRGDWMSDNMVGLATRDQRPNLHYDLVHPETKVVYACPPTGWRYEPKRLMQLIADNEVLFPSTPEGRPRRKRFLKDAKSDFTGLSTVLDTVFNTHATRELRAIFDGKDWFDFPKPVELIKSIIEQGASDPDSIVLDFFSGSGTTAQAVMQANIEDGGHRKFICIQVPEPTDPESEATKAGYKTISDVGKERIRRAGDKIVHDFSESKKNVVKSGLFITEYHEKLGEDNIVRDKWVATRRTVTLPPYPGDKPPDIGFRVFRLDSSNWKKWDDSFVSPDESDLFVERLKAHLDNAKPDRRDIDVVYEVFLKYGVALTEKLSTLEVEGKRFYVVGESGYMFICLDKDITVEVVETAAKYTPGTMIFADECFADNTELTNAALVLEKVGIEFRWI